MHPRQILHTQDEVSSTHCHHEAAEIKDGLFNIKHRLQSSLKVIFTGY